MFPKERLGFFPQQAPGYTIRSDDDLVEATFVFPNTRRAAATGSLRHSNATGYHAAAAAATAVASAAVPVSETSFCTSPEEVA